MNNILSEKCFFWNERLKAHLRRSEVAKDLKIDQSWLSRVEKDYMLASTDLIINLCVYFNVDPDKCKDMIQKKLSKNAFNSKESVL